MGSNVRLEAIELVTTILQNKYGAHIKDWWVSSDDGYDHEIHEMAKKMIPIVARAIKNFTYEIVKKAVEAYKISDVSRVSSFMKLCKDQGGPKIKKASPHKMNIWEFINGEEN